MLWNKHLLLPVLGLGDSVELCFVAAAGGPVWHVCHCVTCFTCFQMRKLSTKISVDFLGLGDSAYLRQTVSAADFTRAEKSTSWSSGHRHFPRMFLLTLCWKCGPPLFAAGGELRGGRAESKQSHRLTEANGRISGPTNPTEVVHLSEFTESNQENY